MIHRAGEQIRAHEIRAAAFDNRWRGLDPEQVYSYLRRLADELDRLTREVTTAHTEAERIRQGLRQWQTRHVGCRFADPDWPQDPRQHR